MRHYCNNEDNCKAKDCVVCLVPESVCEASFTSSRYMEGPTCESCSTAEAMINWTKPEWTKEQVVDYIRTETIRSMGVA